MNPKILVIVLTVVMGVVVLTAMMIGNNTNIQLLLIPINNVLRMGGFPNNNDNVDDNDKQIIQPLELLSIEKTNHYFRQQNSPDSNSNPPPKSNIPASARWLVSSSDHGVLSTLDENTNIPFGNVISYSDGINSQTDRENSTGIPMFYLTTLDETARNLRKTNKASFTISEKWDREDGRCGALDAQEPPCARITLLGTVHVIVDIKEREFAKKSLFSKHPAMSRWPTSHVFEFWKFDIHSIFFLNDYGGAPELTVKDYLNVQLLSSKQYN
jgi:hypothetical protein